METINLRDLKCKYCSGKLICEMKDLRGGAHIQCKCENENCKKEYVVENINGPAPLKIKEI